MSKIEVGEYVRTKNNYIRKVITERLNGYLVDVSYYNEIIDDTTLGIIGKEDIKKHSKQLIDLIEEGDYVNGELITDKWDTRVSSIRSNFSEEDIKTILTKESYMANCYKVGGEDEI